MMTLTGRHTTGGRVKHMDRNRFIRKYRSSSHMDNLTQLHKMFAVSQFEALNSLYPVSLINQYSKLMLINKCCSTPTMTVNNNKMTQSKKKKRWHIASVQHDLQQMTIKTATSTVLPVERRSTPEPEPECVTIRFFQFERTAPPTGGKRASRSSDLHVYDSLVWDGGKNFKL